MSAPTDAASLPLKVLILGPTASYKSALATWLAGSADSIASYGSFIPAAAERGAALPPPPPVRICEIERNGIAVELWDISSDHAYGATWPALMSDASAVLLMFNPLAAGAAKELELWHEWFVLKAGIPFDKCLVLGLCDGAPPAKLSPPLNVGSISVELHSIENEDAIRRVVDRFLARVAASSKTGAKRK